MMTKIKFTEAYEKGKSAMIARYGDNKMLQTAIRILERELPEDSDLKNAGIRYRASLTNLPDRQCKYLACACLYNPDTNEIAPCALFFPKHVFAENDIKTVTKQIMAVKNELAW